MKKLVEFLKYVLIAVFIVLSFLCGYIRGNSKKAELLFVPRNRFIYIDTCAYPVKVIKDTIFYSKHQPVKQ